MTERRQIVRLWAVGLGIAVAFAGLGVRLALLHLGPNESLHRRIASVRHVEEPILVGRGRILDRNRTLLAMDLVVNDVCADPQALLREGYARFVGLHLARALDLEPAVVMAGLNQPDRRFLYVRRRVRDEVAEEVRRLRLAHVWFEPVSARHYPHEHLLAHVIGFSNHEGVGSAGAEQRMDRYLRGRPGVRVSERDGRGVEVLSRRSLEIAPQAGANVHLTLDVHLQQMTERALDDAMERTRSIGAWAAVQEVRTGRILAMASRPAFDLNVFNRADPEDRRNRVIGSVIEPGSTFKAAVIAAALDAGVVTPGQSFDCERGLWMHRGRPLRDYSPHGVLSVADILQRSSNIGAAKIALELGEERLEQALRAFGFGRPTGVDLPGEEAGILHPRRSWSNLSVSRIAMGHEVGVTALQVLNAVCAIANDGFLMQPTVVARVETARGQPLHVHEPTVIGRPIGGGTARLMLDLMARVTEDGGTGRRAAVEGYRVAGKTGTAQKPVPGGYADGLNVASFVGVLPAEHPVIGIIVVLDEPRGERTGGAVAAPVFREIATQAVRYLGIPPSGEVEFIDPSARARARHEREREAVRDPGDAL